MKWDQFTFLARTPVWWSIFRGLIKTLWASFVISGSKPGMRVSRASTKVTCYTRHMIILSYWCMGGIPFIIKLLPYINMIIVIRTLILCICFCTPHIIISLPTLIDAFQIWGKMWHIILFKWQVIDLIRMNNNSFLKDQKP